MRTFVLSVLCLLFSASFATAQTSDFGNWWIYFGNKKLNDRWNIHHEVQYRNYDFIGDLEQLLLRAGVGYNLTENNNNLLLGYGYILSGNYQNDTTKVQAEEHRIYQQYITKQQFGRVSISHRYRFEQRILEDDFKLRFRYFLAAKIALNKKKIERNTIYLSGYNELFLGGESPLFDRNRIYGGLGYAFSPSLKVEAGYMNQRFESANRDQMNLILSYTF